MSSNLASLGDLQAHRTDAQNPASISSVRADPANEPAAITQDDRDKLIAETAYFIAEAQGFPAGCAMQHWLTAEAQINARVEYGTRADKGA